MAKSPETLPKPGPRHGIGRRRLRTDSASCSGVVPRRSPAGHLAPSCRRSNPSPLARFGETERRAMEQLLGTTRSAQGAGALCGRTTEHLEPLRSHKRDHARWTLMSVRGSILDGYSNPNSSALRRETNAWIRTQKLADGVIDFDAATRDHADPDQLNPAYNTTGDKLHPDPTGYAAMADAVDLTQLAAPKRTTATTKARPRRSRPQEGPQGPRSARGRARRARQPHLPARSPGRVSRTLSPSRYAPRASPTTSSDGAGCVAVAM